MSRSGYNEDYDDGNPWLYEQAVSRAFNGHRGQAFLRDMLAALDAMPVKRLIAHEWVKGDEACALGVIAKARGVSGDVAKYDPGDPEGARGAAYLLNIAESMAREVVYWNDECARRETPEERWTRMRKWVASAIQGVQP